TSAALDGCRLVWPLRMASIAWSNSSLVMPASPNELESAAPTLPQLSDGEEAKPYLRIFHKICGGALSREPARLFAPRGGLRCRNATGPRPSCRVWKRTTNNSLTKCTIRFVSSSRWSLNDKQASVVSLIL